MDDLFRFVLLRPANLPDSTEVKVLDPPSIAASESRQEARRQAVQLLTGDRVTRRTEQLSQATTALAVHDTLVAGPRPAEEIRDLIQDVSGRSAENLVASDAFQADEAALADVLVATKLVSDSAQTDARGLGAAAQGYDAIRALVAGADPVRLRPLAMPTFSPAGPTEKTFPDRRISPLMPEDSSGDGGGGESNPIEEKIKRLDTAIAALSRVRATDFEIPRAIGAGAPGQPGDQPATEGADVSPQPTPFQRAVLDTPWKLSPETVSRIDPAILQTVQEVGMDLAVDALPDVIQQLHQVRVENLTLASLQASQAAETVFQIGGSFLASTPASDYVGNPATPMPTGHGSIRPVGIGDLLMVKQHVLRYEGGEVAHVENVLKSEHLDRETRRLERTETTVLTESETTKEDERDTQSTDRFSLKRETSDTLKQDTEFKAGLSVDAKYGPFVEVKANADFATKSSSEESAKQASEFSKDVVSRSVSKVVERVLERRSTTTITEFEEKYSHGFDNTAGSGNISGIYQWVDKVLQAQVYNYGKRMLFDITLPEPGTAFIVAETAGKLEGQAITKPVPFTLTADQVTEGNYAYWGHQYDVTGLEAPPPPVKTISKAFDAVVPNDPYESSKSQDMTIDEGYQASYALLQTGQNYYPSAVWQIMIGSNWVDGFGTAGYFNMAGEVGSVSVAYYTYKVRDLAATIEIFSRRTDRAMKAWQLKTHAALTQGYLAKLQVYDSKLAEAAAAAGVVISGRNPLWNQRITTTELRKQCLTLLTAQQFDAFGALEISAEGYPQPNLARADAQMPYVRFFEQAFEWEHLVYFFYPYFWGWKPGWSHRILLDDVDPLFADFLRAGAARAVFPVRPGFEAAVLHYLESGEIWNGGPPPDVTDPMYVPIIKEIQEATGAPGNEAPQGDPWLVRLPTTLAKLRPHDDLPEWKKVGEDWQPAN
jgi:hypothetical protein